MALAGGVGVGCSPQDITEPPSVPKFLCTVGTFIISITIFLGFLAHTIGVVRPLKFSDTAHYRPFESTSPPAFFLAPPLLSHDRNETHQLDYNQSNGASTIKGGRVKDRGDNFICNSKKIMKSTSTLALAFVLKATVQNGKVESIKKRKVKNAIRSTKCRAQITKRKAHMVRYKAHVTKDKVQAINVKVQAINVKVQAIKEKVQVTKVKVQGTKVKVQGAKVKVQGTKDKVQAIKGKVHITKDKM